MSTIEERARAYLVDALSLDEINHEYLAATVAFAKAERLESFGRAAAIARRIGGVASQIPDHHDTMRLYSETVIETAYEIDAKIRALASKEAVNA